MLRKMPVILLVTILCVIFFGNHLPLNVKSGIYAISLSIKSLIIFFLPIIIFSLLFKASVSLARKATRVVLIIFVSVCISNFISTYLSHFVGSWVYNLDLSLSSPHDEKGLEAYWQFALPKLIPNNIAMFGGLIGGIILSLTKPNIAQYISDKLGFLVAKMLYCLNYLIPLFIVGFIIKLQNDGLIIHIIKDYALIFIIIAISLLIYLTSVYFLANSFSVKKLASTIQNMLPATIVGFSTMSSAAAMPLTIIAAEKNSNDHDLARSIIPATVNIHLIGDCFAIPIFAYAILKNFGVAEPSFIAYLIFTFYFVLAKFSVAAIPGGGIIVMLPVLESYLGFNAEMMSLITALYILFDPIITCANVLGNGAFSLIITRSIKKDLPANQMS